MTTETLFTRIINRDIPADILYEDDQCIVINDIAPQAPVHMLVIPRQPLPRLADASQADRDMLGHLMWVAGEVARQFGVDDAFRLVVNNGADAG
ncbi:MAG: HIT domain-containing protein, partial [Porticoccaceae bacterium]